MNDVERLVNLIYQFLLSEDVRLSDELDNCYDVLKIRHNDSHFAIKYYNSCVRYHEFKILSRKIFDILRRFR